VVADALNFLRAMIPAMIEIRSRLPDNLPKVAVDATQVHQIITNLGSNAAHAMGDKPGVLDVQLADILVTEEQAKVSVDLHTGRYLRLSFTDSGHGIAPEIIERIFEPFFTTKAVGQGTGLGLSVVHGIMTNHEGAIVVSSRQGAGTRFDLYFPVSAQLGMPSTMCAVTDDFASATNKTIVYVDDEEALVFLVTRILERRGYAVRGFTDPALALVELAKQDIHIDALISDLAMPGMTGFDVVRRARALRPNLPMILVSGYVRPQDVELAQQLGVQRLVLKPDTVDGLAAALHEVLMAQASK
jgi:CheY-like chemotaxis protein